jgi:hypothetical protein
MYDGQVFKYFIPPRHEASRANKGREALRLERGLPSPSRTRYYRQAPTNHQTKLQAHAGNSDAAGPLLLSSEGGGLNLPHESRDS